MDTFLKQFKQILITAMLLLLVAPVIAQVKHHSKLSTKNHTLSDQLKEFYHLVAQANVTFVFPKGFKEIKAPEDEDFSFDFALELPGKDFEIWFQVKSEKENWASYVHAQNSAGAQLANPDSAYNDWGKAHLIGLTGDHDYFVRNIPPTVFS